MLATQSLASTGDSAACAPGVGWGWWGWLLLAAAIAVPWIATDYWLKAVLIPAIVFGLSALGLNMLSGTAGLISLGQAAFMAVGAFTAVLCYGRLGVPLPLAIAAAGVASAVIGLIAGIPSLRIRGLYLLVATLAAQFIVLWSLQHAPWIASGAYTTINTPPVAIGSWKADTAAKQYYLALAVTAVLTLFAMRVLRARVGRALAAIRDHDVAADVLGVPVARYKLLAFALSSFYAGVAGSLVVFCWTGAATIQDYELSVSIQLLGMVIIGGLGSVAGAYLGAAFLLLLPVLLNVGSAQLTSALGQGALPAGMLSHVEHIIFGILLLWFLNREPRGLAELCTRAVRRLNLPSWR